MNNGHDQEVLSAPSNGNGHYQDPNAEGQGFESLPYVSDIEKILEFPKTDDMAGILSRGNYKDDEIRVAYVRTIYRLRKYKLTGGRMEFIRDSIASTLGMKAIGKLLQLQVGVKLLAPGMVCKQLDIKESKSGKEDVQRGSDFRQQETNNQFQQGNDQR